MEYLSGLLVALLFGFDIIDFKKYEEAYQLHIKLLVLLKPEIGPQLGAGLFYLTHSDFCFGV